MMMPSEQHDWRRQTCHNGATSLIPGQVLKHTQPAWKGLPGSYARPRVQSCRVQSQSCQSVRIPADLLVTSLAWSNQIFCLPKTRQVRLTQRPEWVEPLPAATRQAWLTKNAYPRMLVTIPGLLHPGRPRNTFTLEPEPQSGKRAQVRMWHVKSISSTHAELALHAHIS